eukprot:gene7644-8945_t
MSPTPHDHDIVQGGLLSASFLIGNFVSLIYLLLAIVTVITAYTGSHRGPFGKHPTIVRFGFMPGLMGSEMCLHLVMFMSTVTLILWKMALFVHFVAKLALMLVVAGCFFLLKTYVEGFRASGVNRRLFDEFCGASAAGKAMPARFSLLSPVRAFQKSIFCVIESFILSLRKQKRDEIKHQKTSHFAEPTPFSFSFWLKMLMPLPHPHYPNVHRIRHIPYGEDNYQKVDVYFHTSCPTSRPILIYIHGGGWREGGGKRHTCGMPLIYQMANQKWIVFSVGYRLAPTNRFPTHINDVKRAITWIRENAVHYGGDIDCIFISGGSAGGHLATLASLTDGRDFEEFIAADANGASANDNPNININMNSLKLESNNQSSSGQFKREYPPFRACISLYAVYDFTNRNGTWPFDLAAYLGSLVMRSTIDVEPDLYSRSSPIDQIREDSSKTQYLIIHGELDELVPIEESLCFIKRFKEVAKDASNITWLEVPIPQQGLSSTHL